MLAKNFSKLTHLTLNIKREFEIPEGKGKIAFPHLRTLEVVAPIDSLQVLVELIDCPSLSRVDIRPYGFCILGELRTCLESIADTWSTNIKDLTVRGWQLWSRELHLKDPIPFVEGIAPVLSRFSSLHSLHLAGSTLFWIDGFHVETLLECLVGLHSLRIDLLWEHPGNLVDLVIFPPIKPDLDDIMALPAPTIAAVHAFARLWPALETLELPVLDMLHVVEPPMDKRLPPRGVGRFTYVRKRKAEDNDLCFSSLGRIYDKVHIKEWLQVPDYMIPKPTATTAVDIEFDM